MASPGRASDAWRAGAGLRWKQFTDSSNWVVYHPGTGDVHLLSSEAGELWRMIENGTARSFDQLVAAFIERSGQSADVVSESIRSALTTMDDAGLIEPADL